MSGGGENVREEPDPVRDESGEGGNATGTLGRTAGFLRSNGIWLTALLTVAVFFGSFLVTDAGAVLRALSRVDAGLIALVFALVTVAYGVRFLKWAYYLRELDVSVPLGTSLLVFFSGLMMVVTPGKLGEVWKGWFLRDLRGVPVARTATVVGAERATDLLALVAFALLGVLVFDRSSTLMLGVAAAFVVGLVVLQWRSLCLGILRRCRGLPVVGRYAADLEEFYDDAHALFRARPLAVAMLVSLAAWGLEGYAFWLTLQGFGVDAGVVFALFVFAFGSVVGALSLLPGGLAAAEASMVGVLVAAGHPADLAVAATLVIRIATLWYGAVLGTAVFGSYRFRKARAEG